MTNEELIIAKEILHIVQNSSEAIANSSTFAYDIAIKGTVAYGFTTIICIVCAFTICCSIMNWIYSKIDTKSDGDLFFGCFGGLIACSAVIIIFMNIIRNSLMSIMVPEYVVLMKFMELALP